MSNLTTTASVKAYLGITVSTQDALIDALIVRASASIQNYCGRQFPSQTFTNQRLNGSGTNRVALRGPVLSVSAVQVGADVLTVSPDNMSDAGWAYDENTLYLVPGTFPSAFPQGFNNVKASWVAGYQSSEAAYVPTGNTPTVTPTTDGNAATNVSVSYANGTALTQVGSGPLVGQYSFTAPTYTFNSADYNRLLTFSYYYVPSSVEQACIEMVALKLKQKTNIGVRSQGLAGESISYEDRDMTPAIKLALGPYVLRSYA